MHSMQKDDIIWNVKTVLRSSNQTLTSIFNSYDIN